MGATALGRIDRMLDPAAGQMFWQAIASVGSGLALAPGQAL
jgi:hypothetical protein